MEILRSSMSAKSSNKKDYENFVLINEHEIIQ